MVHNFDTFQKEFLAFNTEQKKSLYFEQIFKDQKKYSFSDEFEFSICTFYLKHSKNFELTFEHTKVLLRIADVKNKFKKFDEAMSILSKVLAISEKYQYYEIIDLSYSLSGLLELNKGEYKKALEYFELSKPVILATKKKERASILYNNFGVIHYHLGNLDESLKFYLISLDYLEQNELSKSHILLYINIATIYIQLASLELAKEYAEKALNISEQLDLKNLIVKSLAKLATVVSMLKDFESGYIFSCRALGIYEEIGTDIDLSRSYILRADILRELKKPVESLVDLNKALEISIRQNDPIIEGSIMRSIALVFMNDLKKYDSALRYIQRVYEIFSDTEFKEYWIQAHFLFALYYKNCNDTKKSLSYINKVLEDPVIDQWVAYKVEFLQLLLELNNFTDENQRTQIEIKIIDTKKL